VSRINGMKLMRSQRWASDCGASKKRNRGLPYVMKSGHISGSCRATWVCSAYQWYATTVRSVIENISKRSIVKKKNRRKTRRHLTMIACLYVLTNDESMLERLLCCQRRGFQRTFYFFLSRVDDKTRFCYDQAARSANWFELRGNPRVQSTRKTILPQYRNFDQHSYSAAREIRERMNSICDPWIVDGYSFTRGMHFLTNRGSLGDCIY